MTAAADPSAIPLGTRVGGREHVKRALALSVICLGVLIVVVDTTIVNVALSSISSDLSLSGGSLVWVVNAYMLPFGGFLLLGGRLGDRFGHRRLFVIGIAVFTSASFACGLAHSQATLLAARALQGFGGAIPMSVSLSLIIQMFPDAASRARAMGTYGFVCASGGTVGVLLGGFLVQEVNWHWIFLVNVPVGIAVCACASLLIPRGDLTVVREPLDVFGALTLTGSLLAATYAIMHGSEVGWSSPWSLGVLVLALILLSAGLAIERRALQPVLPVEIFRDKALTISNVIAVLWAAGRSPWFFMSALYMQKILGYAPSKVGLAFLPANILAATLALFASARLTLRLGVAKAAATGLLLGTLGLLLFARLPTDGNFGGLILPSMLLLGASAGITLNPLLVAATSARSTNQPGLMAGIVNTSLMAGGTFGLSVLAAVAAAYSNRLVALGATPADALTGGYRVALVISAAITAVAALLAVLGLERGKPLSL